MCKSSERLGFTAKPFHSSQSNNVYVFGLKILGRLPRLPYCFDFSVEPKLRNSIIDLARMERTKNGVVTAIVRTKMSISQLHQTLEVPLTSFDQLENFLTKVLSDTP
jgi:hypothetical protein